MCPSLSASLVSSSSDTPLLRSSPDSRHSVSSNESLCSSCTVDRHRGSGHSFHVSCDPFQSTTPCRSHRLHPSPQPCPFPTVCPFSSPLNLRLLTSTPLSIPPTLALPYSPLDLPSHLHSLRSSQNPPLLPFQPQTHPLIRSSSSCEAEGERGDSHSSSIGVVAFPT